MADIYMLEALKQILTPSCTQRFISIIGGRGSGKSTGVAAIAAVLGSMGKRELLGREYQKSIKESMHKAVSDQIHKIGIPGYSINKTEITHASGGHIIFSGLSVNPESIKSLEGIDILIVDEAQVLSTETLRLVTPTIRKPNSKLIFVANPRSVADPFSQRFLTMSLPRLDQWTEADDLHMRITLNYNDNPWFSQELERERQYDFETMPRSLYDHIWLGHYCDDVDNSIISSEVFDACVDAHKKLKFPRSGATFCAHDPADTGDARATCVRDGNIITYIDEDKKRSINDACDYALQVAKEHHANLFVYDADGCGLGLRAQIQSFWNQSPTPPKVFEFKGGLKPENSSAKLSGRNMSMTNATQFKNLRSQCYYKLSNAMHMTSRALRGEYVDLHDCISIDSNCGNLPQLKQELCAIPKVNAMGGHFTIMPKHDIMKKLKRRSPNLADALMMTFVNFGTSTQLNSGLIRSDFGVDRQPIKPRLFLC